MRRRTVAALLLLSSVLAVACASGPADLEGELVAAAERTLADSFTYRLTVEADRDALGSLGQDAQTAAAFLRGFAVRGSVAEGSGELQVMLSDRAILDVRRAATDRTYLRLALRDVAGFPSELLDPDTLLPVLRQLGLGEAVERALATLLREDWLLLEGEVDLARLREIVADGEQPTPLAALLGVDLEERVRRFVDVREHSESDGQRTFRIDVRLRELVGALRANDGGTDPGDTPSSLPDALPGTVFVTDGLITRIRVDIGPLTDQDDASGRVELQLDLGDHGDVGPPREPAAGATLATADLLDALSTLLRFVAGVAGG